MASILNLLNPGAGATGTSMKTTAFPGQPTPSVYRAAALQTQIPVVYSAFQHASQNPYDWSRPIMGLATGKMLSEYSGAIQQAGAEQTEQQERIRQGWAAALSADPDIVNNPAKLIQTAMQIDPAFLDRFKTAMEVSKLSQETRRIGELTPAEKAQKEAQTIESLAGAGLKQEQALSAEALRQPEVQLKGAQAGKYQAETQKTLAEIPLLGRENKYRVPVGTYGPITEAMVAQFWPLARMNIPDELQNNAALLLSDPMTGKPNEAKIRAFLPTDMQRRYDQVKLLAEQKAAAGLPPQQAVQEAMQEAGVPSGGGGVQFRPPVRFR